MPLDSASALRFIFSERPQLCNAAAAGSIRGMGGSVRARMSIEAVLERGPRKVFRSTDSRDRPSLAPQIDAS